MDSKLHPLHRSTEISEKSKPWLSLSLLFSPYINMPFKCVLLIRFPLLQFPLTVCVLSVKPLLSLTFLSSVIYVYQSRKRTANTYCLPENNLNPTRHKCCPRKNAFFFKNPLMANIICNSSI